MLVPRVPLALTLAVAVGSTLASPVNSVAAPPTCFGKRATIVGDGVLRGTSGPDVIVATGSASEVHAGGGNDRICGWGSEVPTSSWLPPLFAFLYGGDGVDRCEAEHFRGCEQD